MTLHIDLHQAPPTQEQLDAAFAAARELDEAIARSSRRDFGLAMLFAAAFVGHFIVALAFDLNEATAKVMFATVLASLVLGVLFVIKSSSNHAPTSHLYEALPQSKSTALVECCARDRPVDDYRLKVVAQGRALTVLEFETILRWDDSREQRRMAALAANPEPITDKTLKPADAALPSHG